MVSWSSGFPDNKGPGNGHSKALGAHVREANETSPMWLLDVQWEEENHGLPQICCLAPLEFRGDYPEISVDR